MQTKAIRLAQNSIIIINSLKYSNSPQSFSWKKFKFLDKPINPLTKLSNQGVPLEGTLVDDWKFDFLSHDAHRLVCNDQADMTVRFLTGLLTFDCRIMHYIIVRIFLPRSSNLAQAYEEDLILMWDFLTGRQIDWAYLIRNRMHKALRANAPLPYPHLVTLFLHHFKIPLDDEPFVQVQRSFAIGAGAVISFGYRKERKVNKEKYIRD